MKWGLLLLVALSLLPSRAGLAVDLDSLLIYSVGGSGALQLLKETKAIHLSGKVNFNGMDGTFDTYFMSPDRYFAELDFGQFTLAQSFDGERAMNRNHNGHVSELTGHERQQLLGSIYLESYSYVVPGRLPGGVEYLGEIEEGGTTYHQVAFFPFHNDTILAEFDEAEGKLRRTQRRIDNLKETALVGDYRVNSGVYVPYYARTFFDKAPMTTEYIVHMVEFDGPIDSTIFTMNPAPPEDFRFAPGLDTARIPFSYSRGHIFVRVSINGRRPTWFILDSGASANIINTSAVKAYDLPTVGAMPALGIGGYEQFQLVRTDSLVIGELALVDQISGAADLSALAITTPTSEPLSGILGHDFLSRLPVLVDYGDSTLTIFRSGAFVPPKNGTEIPFRLVMNIPVIEARLNGIAGEWLIDLGNAAGLVILPEYASRHRLERELRGLKESDGLYGGIGGALKGRTGYADSFEIGDFRLSSPEVLLIGSGEGIGESIEVDGIIGRAVLEKFAVLFDYTSQRLIMYDRSR